jgi:hypothetical protein
MALTGARTQLILLYIYAMNDRSVPRSARMPLARWSVGLALLGRSPRHKLGSIRAARVQFLALRVTH